MTVPWAALAQLRAGFIDPRGPRRDYWFSTELLAAYDATFAQRIAWKWRAVLAQARMRGWSPPAVTQPIVDFGCGTGVASREFVAAMGSPPTGNLILVDRSERAAQFAAMKFAEAFPQWNVEIVPSVAKGIPEGATVLSSHIGNEIDPRTRGQWLRLLKGANACVLLEPGTPQGAAFVADARDVLRKITSIVAPCLQSGACPLRVRGTSPPKDWCHVQVPTPQGVYRDPFWAEFQRRLQVSLADQACSFLLTDRTWVQDPSCARPVFLGEPRRGIQCNTQGRIVTADRSSDHQPVM